MMPNARRRTRIALLSFAAALAVAFAGCASNTSLVEHWRDPSWTSAPMGTVFVVALRRDPVRRRMWEDGFVEALKARGVNATPSYTQFPDAAPDTQQVIDVVRAQTYDGVIVSTRLPNVQEQREVLPTATRVAEARRNPFTGMYYTIYRDVYTPGYVETDEVRRFQTDIWTTKEGGRLVWSGSVSSYDPATKDLVEAVVEKEVMPQATKDGIFPRKT
jgi:hypothetical protein